MYVGLKPIAVSFLAVTAALPFASLRAEVVLNDFLPFVDVVETCDDIVLLEGELHCLISTQVDEGGRTHLHVLSHPRAIDGVSLVDGSEYVGAGANTFSLSAVFPDGDGTATQQVVLVLAGKDGRTYVLITQFKVTIADGEVRVFFEGTKEVVCD